MKIILLQDEKKLGKKGDIIEVSEGYARNFVIPKKIGVEATPKNLNDLKLKKQNEEKVAKEIYEEAVAFAQKVGADVLVSADFKHHVILAALERGVSVLAPTHYATENYGFKNYFMKISKAIKIPCVYHEDKQLL